MIEEKPYSLSETTSAIERATEQLFSEGVLSEKIAQAHALYALPGLDLYATAIPWIIKAEKQDPIEGFSETLRFAAKDIHAYLKTIAKSLPPDIRLSLDIDETRLPEPRASAEIQ